MRKENVPSYPTSSQAGFTFIGLTIVVIALGFLIGSMMVGEHIAATAFIRSQVSQVDNYNTAATTFRDKYGGLPGDLRVPLAKQFGFVVPPDCTGQQGGRDGNGLIEGYASPNSLAAVMGENMLFWMDLAKVKFVDDSVPYTRITDWSNNYAGLCTTSNKAAAVKDSLPPGRIGGGNYLHVYAMNGANWFMLAHIISVNGAHSRISAQASLTVSQAYSIDAKIDDGIATTGRVQAVYINDSSSATTTPSHAATDSDTTCYNSKTGDYSTHIHSGSGANCALSFKMQAGD